MGEVDVSQLVEYPYIGVDEIIDMLGGLTVLSSYYGSAASARSAIGNLYTRAYNQVRFRTNRDFDSDDTSIAEREKSAVAMVVYNFVAHHFYRRLTVLRTSQDETFANLARQARKDYEEGLSFITALPDPSSIVTYKSAKSSRFRKEYIEAE